MYSVIYMLLIGSSVTLAVTLRQIPKNHVPYKNRKSVHQSPEELATIFYSSIVYWDFDKSDQMPNSIKSDMKQDIMRELVQMSADSSQCICSKILGPLICDSTGTLHSSICRFHCRFASHEKAAITPVMILAETSFQKSKKMCDQWFKGKEIILSPGPAPVT